MGCLSPWSAAMCTPAYGPDGRHGTDATGLGLLRSPAECSASDPTLVPDPSLLGEIEPVE